MIDNRSASLANALLGAWLFASGFLWHHSKANFVNASTIGVVVVASALMAIRVPWFRFVTAAAGLWLITGLFAGGQVEAVTVWHNVMVGLGIVLASTVGRRPDRSATRGDLPRHGRGHLGRERRSFWSEPPSRGREECVAEIDPGSRRIHGYWFATVRTWAGGCQREDAILSTRVSATTVLALSVSAWGCYRNGAGKCVVPGAGACM